MKGVGYTTEEKERISLLLVVFHHHYFVVVELGLRSNGGSELLVLH